MKNLRPLARPLFLFFCLGWSVFESAAVLKELLEWVDPKTEIAKWREPSAAERESRRREVLDAMHRDFVDSGLVDAIADRILEKSVAD